MRSRYSAFVKQQIGYLKDTTWPPYQKHFDELGYQARSVNSIWLGLQILECESGTQSDTKGYVTFVAKAMMGGVVQEHREKSLFKRKSDRWYYVKPVD